MEITSAACWKMLKNTQESYLVDVRTSQEWKEFGIPDLEEISKEVFLLPVVLYDPFAHKNPNFVELLQSKFIDKNSNIIFICKSGGRSMMALNIARELGYNNVFSVSDGFLGNQDSCSTLNGWINCNLPWKNH